MFEWSSNNVYSVCSNWHWTFVRTVLHNWSDFCQFQALRICKPVKKSSLVLKLDGLEHEKIRLTLGCHRDKCYLYFTSYFSRVDIRPMRNNYDSRTENTSNIHTLGSVSKIDSKQSDFVQRPSWKRWQRLDSSQWFSAQMAWKLWRWLQI